MVTVRMFSIDEKFHLRLSDGGGDPDTNVGCNHVHEGEPCSGHVLVDHYLHDEQDKMLPVGRKVGLNLVITCATVPEI